MVYPRIIIAIIFINREVLKKLLSGLMTNKTIITIENAEHIHIFLVALVKIVKLNDC